MRGCERRRRRTAGLKRSRLNWRTARSWRVRCSRLAYVLATTIAWFAGSGERSWGNSGAPGSAWSFNQLRERARQLALSDFKPAGGAPLSDEIKKLNYDQYHQIQFRPEHAPWPGESRFQVHLIHRGYLFGEPIRFHLVENGQSRELRFATNQFHYGGVTPPRSAPVDFGFAGFKIVFQAGEARPEIASFLGASYFRIVGTKQHYGASARALAIDTGETRAEEFPRFTEFWIEKPAPEGDFLRLYALLDSPSASGAYRFVLKPGEVTVAEIEGSLFPRDPSRKFGLAPITSMFLMGEERWRQVSDFRPEVHDSDGLLVRSGSVTAAWRPLLNPEKKHVISRFAASEMDGFGLLQRDRLFNNYQDLQARYDLRPSFWVKPVARWGTGVVELVEIPSDTEYNDNIVAYWVPETKPAKGQELRYGYTLSALSMEPASSPLLKVMATRIARGDGKKPTKFVVDFSGDSGPAQSGGSLQGRVEGDESEVTNLVTQRNDVTGGWRVAFELADERADSELRLSLRKNGKIISETWTWRQPRS